MIERIEAFRAKNNNALPARIIVYRDGVSEGQFNTVIVEEIVFELVRTLYLRSSNEVTTTAGWWHISREILH